MGNSEAKQNNFGLRILSIDPNSTARKVTFIIPSHKKLGRSK